MEQVQLPTSNVDFYQLSYAIYVTKTEIILVAEFNLGQKILTITDNYSLNYNHQSIPN